MRVIFFANTDWYLYNFRLPLANVLRSLGADVILVSPPGPYVTRLVERGFRWIALPMQRQSLNPIRELLLVLRLARIYRRERPDIVHHFTIKCVVYGSFAARFARIARRINAVAGLGYVFSASDRRARLLRPFVRLLMRIALGGAQSRLILQNREDREAFEGAKLLSSTSIRLIPGSGVDTHRFVPAPKPTGEERPFTVIFAARLLWDKGIGELVDAARILRKRGVDIKILVAGAPDPGNPASVPEVLIQRWHNEGVIAALGHVENMPDLLHQAHAAVLPSYYREGVPRSLIEAAATGLPIVTTDAPGCRDIVEHGHNGLLVKPKDPIDLANAIQWLYENPVKRAHMGQAGREKVLREFTEELVLARTIEVYRELMPDALWATQAEGERVVHSESLAVLKDRSITAKSA